MSTTLPSPFTANRQIIVPRKGIQELSRLLGDADDSLTIQISSNTIRVNLGQVTFSAKLIEGRYPDYQRVMPRELSRIYQADKEELKSALSRASLLTSEKQKSVSLEVDEAGLMILKAQNSEHEEAEERLMVDAQGGSVSVGLPRMSRTSSRDIPTLTWAKCASFIAFSIPLYLPSLPM